MQRYIDGQVAGGWIAMYSNGDRFKEGIKNEMDVVSFIGSWNV